MTQQLPDQYTPGQRDRDRYDRDKRPTVPHYTVGIEQPPGSVGMTHGPLTDVYDALDCPATVNGVIVRFNVDGTDEPLYRAHNGRWVLGGDPPEDTLPDSLFVNFNKRELQTLLKVLKDADTSDAYIVEDVLAATIGKHDDVRDTVLNEARRVWCGEDDDIEIDDDAMISTPGDAPDGAEGYFVMGWLYVTA